MTAPDSQPPFGVPRDRVFWSLLAAAVVSRLVWVIWIHPPQDHVFSDMAHYVHRARLVANFETEAGMRAMAWQAFGTHVLLAIPMLLLGPGQSALELAGLMWAACSAATVVLGYELAWAALPGREGGGRRWAPVGVGVGLLLWFPLISHAGFFVSETPYTCALLASTVGVVRAVHTGRGAVSAGVWAAVAFVLRPQVAVWLGLMGAVWVWDRWRGPSWSRRVNGAVAGSFLAPILVVLVVSGVRFTYFTGALGVTAENASMNLTAGRCHNVVTRAYSSEALRDEAARTGERLHDRRVSLPGFRALARRGPEHPLALRPALGTEQLDIVGYIGDPEPHAALRRRCYAATGLAGQVRYAAVNVALLVAVARPWPEGSDHGSPQWLAVAVLARDVAAGLAPLVVLGVGLALAGWALAGSSTLGPAELERHAGLGLCALQVVSLLVVAAVFFGSPRLRTPYDVYGLILATSVVIAGVRVWGRVRGRGGAHLVPSRSPADHVP